MTKEQAIDIIKCLAWHTRPDEERIEQAIKALEQQPSDDCVSRADVLEMFGYETTIYDLPPVTPTFPKGATNYDVLKAVFGGISAFRIKDTMEFEKGFESWFSKPYKRGNENGSN